MWKVILKTQSILSRFLIIFQWDALLWDLFFCLQWVPKRGKRVSVTISWLALHSSHSGPALQPAQTWAPAPDGTGASLLCCRWGFGSCSSSVHDSPFQDMMLCGGSTNANTTACSLKGRHLLQSDTNDLYTWRNHAETAPGNSFIIVPSCQDWKIRCAFLKWHTMGGVVGV